MARARNIKPGFFKNEFLGALPPQTSLLFIGLWTLADREGRLEDRPARIKAELFSFYNYSVGEVDEMLDSLAALQSSYQDHPFIIRYVANGKRLIQIVSFLNHQNPHRQEKPSVIPPYVPEQEIKTPKEHQTSTPCIDGKSGASSEEAPDFEPVQHEKSGASSEEAPCKFGTSSEQAPDFTSIQGGSVGLNPESPLLNPDSTPIPPSAADAAVCVEGQEQTKRFSPPSRSELAAFLTTKGLTLCDPDEFLNHYGSNGWKVGRNAMKDWKLAAANWHHRRKNGTAPGGKNGKPPDDDPGQKIHTYAELNELRRQGKI